MSELRRYHDYKDSGVPWLGEIPSHWEAKKVKYLVEENLKYGSNEACDSVDLDLPRYIRITDIDKRGNLKKDTFKSMSMEKAKEYLLEPLDILIARSGSIGKSYIYREILENKACHAGYLIKVRADSNLVSPYFFYYFLQCNSYWDWIELSNVQSTIQNVNAEKYSNLKLSLPPVDEQQAIVNFLDDKLDHIDTLISKQQQLIEKLAEQRSAVITHAVTKGLNPDVPMKDSGVEWLGEIPEHWDLVPVRYVTNYVGSGKTPKGGAEVYVDDGIMMIRSQNVYDDGLRLDNVIYITEEAHSQQANTEVLPEDVLLNITGASLGRVTIAPKNLAKANVNQHVCILRSINNKIEPEFLKLLFQSLYFKTLVKADENGSSREGLNFQQIKAMKLTLPSIMEQRKIIHFVYAELSIIDKMSKATKDIITKLQEYRAALITQAVTGKIDVRHLNQQAS